MRIPFTDLKLRLAADAPAPDRPPRGELGIPGLKAFGGMVEEEYLSTLYGSAGLDVYDKMLRSDEQVGMIYHIISMPIRGAAITVEPAGGGSADQEAVDLIQRNLLDPRGMSHSFDRFLQTALMSTMLGYSLVETVYEERDGNVMVRKFAPRHPRTVQKWLFDEDGGVAGIEQYGTAPDGHSVSGLEIPIDRLLLFTWDDPFGNPEGLALCRRMYKAWYIKEFLLKTLAIGIEREWLGIPVGKQPFDADGTDRDNFLSALKRLRGGEDVGMVLPFGWELDEFWGKTRSGSDLAMSLLNWCDQAMARAALAQMIMLGTTQTGARSVGETMSDFFIMADQAIGDFVMSILNDHLIPRLCGYNFPGLKDFPKLVLADVGARLHVAQLADALSKLVTGGSVITARDDLENAVCEMLGLPPLPEDMEGDRDKALAPPAPNPNAPPPPGAPPAPDEPLPPGKKMADVGGASAPIVETIIPLAGIRATLDAGEQQLDGKVRDHIETQLNALADRLRPLIRRARSGKPQERARLQQALSALAWPDAIGYRALMRSHLDAVVQAGLRAAEATYGVQAPKRVPRDIAADLDSQAQAVSTQHLANLLFAVRAQVQRDVAGGLDDDTVLANLRNAARSRLSSEFASSLTEAADLLSARLAAQMRVKA